VIRRTWFFGLLHGIVLATLIAFAKFRIGRFGNRCETNRATRGKN
jgi:hypothetical protein